MQLREFVRQTLVDIEAGLMAASDAYVHPDPSYRYAYQIEGKERCVHFDIAVTVSSEEKGGAGGSIEIAWLKVGGAGEQVNTQHSVSRIQFSVFRNEKSRTGE